MMLFGIAYPSKQANIIHLNSEEMTIKMQSITGLDRFPFYRFDTADIFLNLRL